MNATKLIVRHNQIAELLPYQFSNLTELTQLNVRKNPVSVISETSFCGTQLGNSKNSLDLYTFYCALVWIRRSIGAAQ